MCNNHYENNMEAYENLENGMEQEFFPEPEASFFADGSEMFDSGVASFDGTGGMFAESPEFFEDVGNPAMGAQSFGEENFSAFSGSIGITPFSVAPTITFPGQNAIVPFAAVTLRWNAVSGATGYRMAVRNITTDRIIVSDRILGAGVHSFTIAVGSLEAGHRYRFAIASIVGGTQRWTEREFSVQLNAPTVTAPTANATVTRQALTLRWNAVPGAVAYRMAVRNVTTDRVIVSDRTFNSSTLTHTIPVASLLPGHRYRFAIASVSGAVQRWTEREFSVALTEADRNRANPTPVLSGNLREDIVAIARSQIYVRETATNRNPYSREVVGSDGHHWCGDFAAWVIRRAGRINHVIHNWNVHLNNARIGSGWNFSLASNWIATPNDGRWNQVTTPLAGDIVVWQDHIALVTSVIGNNITFVGGNQSNQVDERTTTRNNPAWGSQRFLGYLRVQ